MFERIGTAPTWIHDVIIYLAEEHIKDLGFILVLDQARRRAEIARVGLSKTGGGAVAVGLINERSKILRKGANGRSSCPRRLRQGCAGRCSRSDPLEGCSLAEGRGSKSHLVIVHHGACDRGHFCP